MTDDFLSPPIERSSEPKRQNVRAICAALDRLRKDVSVEGGRLIIAEKADVRALLDDYARLTTEPSYVNGFEDGQKHAAAEAQKTAPTGTEGDNFSTLVRKLVAWRTFDDVKFRTISVEEIRTLVEGIEAMAGFKVAAERDGWIKRAEVAEAEVERFKADVADLNAECDRIAEERDKAAEERDRVAEDHTFWRECAEERGKRLILLEARVEKAKAVLFEEPKS